MTILRPRTGSVDDFDEIKDVLPPLSREIAKEINSASPSLSSTNAGYPYDVLQRSNRAIREDDEKTAYRLLGVVHDGSLDAHPLLAALIALRGGALEEVFTILDREPLAGALADRLRLHSAFFQRLDRQTVLLGERLGDKASWNDLVAVASAYERLGDHAGRVRCLERAYWIQPTTSLAQLLLDAGRFSANDRAFRRWALDCLKSGHHSRPVLAAIAAEFAFSGKIGALRRVLAIARKYRGKAC